MYYTRELLFSPVDSTAMKSGPVFIHECVLYTGTSFYGMRLEPFKSYKALKVSQRPQIVHQTPFLTLHLETPKDVICRLSG